MEAKLIKNLQAEYIPAVWSGADTSGIRVVGKTVLVLMDACSGMTTGNIALPPDYVERMSMSSESGVLVAVSPGAFLLNEDMTPWTGEKPKAGDRVYIEKYAGKLVKGRDGKTYRIMDYSSIGAVYETGDLHIPVDQTTFPSLFPNKDAHERASQQAADMTERLHAQTSSATYEAEPPVEPADPYDPRDTISIGDGSSKASITVVDGAVTSVTVTA